MKIQLSGHYDMRRIIKTSAPVVIMMIVISVYSIVDGLFVSNFIGVTAFAGMNIIWPVIMLASCLGMMFGTGGSALVSKIVGEGDVDRANDIFTMLMRLSVVIGVVVGALIFAFTPKIVTALGAEAEMAEMAVLYGRIVILALPFFIVQIECESFYMAAEKPQFGTCMSIICGVVHIGLDAFFIFVCDMGLAGVALATAISLTIGGCFPLYYFASSRNDSLLHFTSVRRVDWRAILKSCTNGMSEYVGNIALNVVGICYNFQLLRYIGEAGVSAYGIIMYVSFIFAAVFLGYDLCISQVISFNYGAGNKEELRSLLRKSLKMIGVSGVVLTLLAEVSAPGIARFFFSSDDLCALAVRSMRIYMLSFLICGFNLFASAWFTALNNGLVSAVVAFARTMVFELLCVFLLPLAFGLDGVWMSVNVAEIMALILSITLMLAYRKKYLV